MQSHRILSGFTIFLMVILVAAGWFLVAQPQLASASDASTQLAGVQSQIATTQTTIAQLKSEQKEIPNLKETLADLRVSIPTEIESSAYITGLNALAAEAGVTITTITVGDGQPYTPAVAATPPAAKNGGTSPSPSPTATAGPTAAPVAPPVSGWTPPTDARITGSNFILIPVTVGVAGDWGPTVAFLKGLQAGTRLFLVKGLTIAHDTTDPSILKTTATGFIYVIIDPKAAALAKSDAPSPTITPTPTPTPTSTVTPDPSGSSTPTPTTSPTP